MMITTVDQTGREIILKTFPKKIVSVVPSQTELLFDLGLNDEVIGVTKFCVHPAGAMKTKTIIGGTKNLNVEKIFSLNPDLILANKEENSREQFELLAKNFQVWISDVKNLDDALAMIKSAGTMTNKVHEANFLIERINSGFLKIRNPKSEIRNFTSVYLIWHNPMMTVGSDTFIHHMMQRCGFENVFADKKRYPQISARELQEMNPEIILLSTEPFPFREKHIAHYRNISPSSKIILVDGEMFSWYGSRLQFAPEYFLRLMQSLR